MNLQQLHPVDWMVLAVTAEGNLVMWVGSFVVVGVCVGKSITDIVGHLLPCGSFCAIERGHGAIHGIQYVISIHKHGDGNF